MFVDKLVELITFTLIYLALVGNYVLRLEIHGRLGAICHAIQESRYNSSDSSEPNYQTFE